MIVDDSTEFLDAASSLLEREGLEIVGLASTTAEAVRRTAELRPDLMLVDIQLGRENGFELAELLAPRVIIMISTHAADDFSELLAAGPAVGFVPKSELSREAIRAVLAERGDRLASRL
jgi:two-component system, NarL family, nitrate/nitrite response regulator NarL